MLRSVREDPYESQLGRLEEREARLLRPKGGGAGPGSLMAKIEKKIPDKLQGTMDLAFYKAFQILFQHGTGLLERVFRRKRLRADFIIRMGRVDYGSLDPQRAVRQLDRGAGLGALLNVAVATTEGFVLGLLGLGLPDIPILLALLLRGVYKAASRFGFSYDTPEERYYILLLLCAALAPQADRAGYSRLVDETGRALDRGERPSFQLEEQMRRTAKELSASLLVVKFIQGYPIVGLIGGVYNCSITWKVERFAALKYQKRFLEKIRDSRSAQPPKLRQGPGEVSGWRKRRPKDADRPASGT